MAYSKGSLALHRKRHVTSHSDIYASFAGVGAPRDLHEGAFETSKIWWNEERIQATVTRSFILSKLRPNEQPRLDERPGFGGELTDNTYLEWICRRAKRLFLILVDLGVAGRIFGVLDDSWDDDDLPVPLNQVRRIRLTYRRDERIERQFFHRQFYYLLRHIHRGDHLVYSDEELVPLEPTQKRPAYLGMQSCRGEQVAIPDAAGLLLLRRPIPLGMGPQRMLRADFLSGIAALKGIQHRHLRSLWASFIHRDCGYLLLTPVETGNLRSLFKMTPPSLKILTKQDQRFLFLNWIHCLADALSYLHFQGLSHQRIQPSTVMLDTENHVFLTDSEIFLPSTERHDSSRETYQYSAPENFLRPTARPPQSVAHPNPENPSVATPAKFNPQKSDIFSLGAIFLEIITLLMKRKSRCFASYRLAPHISARHSTRIDSSFHGNQSRVASWISLLVTGARKKKAPLFRGIPNILELIAQMLHADPDERPTAAVVRRKISTILMDECALRLPETGQSRLHCVPMQDAEHPAEIMSTCVAWDELRCASQRAAAEACSSLAPVTANGGILGVKGGAAYALECKAYRCVTDGGTEPANSHGMSETDQPKARAWRAPVYAELSWRG